MEKYSSGRRGVTRKQTALVTVYFPKPLHRLAFTEFDPRQRKQAVYSFLSKFRNSKIWRVVRVVEGAALEMLCSQKEPRVRIPNSPPSTGATHFVLRLLHSYPRNIARHNKNGEAFGHLRFFVNLFVCDRLLPRFVLFPVRFCCTLQ